MTRKKQKTVILTVFGAMCLIGLISWYFIYINPSALQRSEDKTPEKETVGMYGSTQSYIFYPADEELDAEAAAKYKELDRELYFTFGAETIAIDTENTENLNEDVKFFYDYFQTVMKGDYTTYNTLFTDKYFETNEKTCDFTRQLLYDMKIEKIYEETAGGYKTYYYNVDYKIYRNNGTFRNDMGSDATRTLYFTLKSINGSVLIDSIEAYS